jgi:DNA polymerase-1
MLQLVNPLTTVNLLKTGISDILAVTPQNFAEVYFGLTPAQVTDFKGISGDSSDILSGVTGIGPKTASKLILEYGSLEKIYENLDKLSEAQKNKFISSKEHAFMCKRLSTISMNEYENFNIEDFAKKSINVSELRDFINKYHFNGFDKYFE